MNHDAWCSGGRAILVTGAPVLPRKVTIKQLLWLVAPVGKKNAAGRLPLADLL
jgi:hypothetical protein